MEPPVQRARTLIIVSLVFAFIFAPVGLVLLAYGLYRLRGYPASTSLKTLVYASVVINVAFVIIGVYLWLLFKDMG